MPNNLSFEGEFIRKQMENLLKNASVEIIVVSGKYTHQPDSETRIWDMEAFAEGYTANRVDLVPPREEGCIQPCPRT